MFSLMLFIFLCFLGMLAVQFYMLRSQERLNRALRDEDGEVYDIVAGTFLIAGLTEDNFGSLSSDLALKYSHQFEQPEVFAKLGDRIIAIPMISEEQQKQEAKEQKDFEVNMDTSGLAVSGHVGTWHTIDHMEVDGHTFFLMEHDTLSLIHI